jgi:hypothetical protein
MNTIKYLIIFNKELKMEYFNYFLEFIGIVAVGTGAGMLAAVVYDNHKQVVYDYLKNKNKSKD